MQRKTRCVCETLMPLQLPFFKKKCDLDISMDESNTVVSAYTLYILPVKKYGQC